MTVRIGFIGASAGEGSWAYRAHMPYFNSPEAKASGTYTITAVQNSSIESGKKAAEVYKLGDVKIYDNPASIASDPNVDLVAVSVKVPSHLDAILPALEAGKDVFSEWPLGRDLAEAERLNNLAKEKGVKTLVGLQARQNPSIVAAKKLVEAGELGQILGSTVHGYGLLHGPTVAPDYLYTLPIEHGANNLTIPFGHAVDAVLWVLGELDFLQATLTNGRPEVDYVDGDGKFIKRVPKTSHDHIAVNGVLKNGGGLLNVVYQGNLPPAGVPGFRWQIEGTKATLLLEGPMGHVQMWQPTIKIVKAGDKEAKDVEGVKWVGPDFKHNVGLAWEAFAGIGSGNLTTWEDAVVRHRMIDAIYRSNEKGTRERYI